MSLSCEDTRCKTVDPVDKRFVRLQRHRPHLPPSPEGLASLGTIVDGRYELQTVLGIGASAVVYLARDPALRRLVAVKMLARGASNETVARFFREEAVAMASVCHPNVVQVHAYGEQQGMPYIVMEHVEGQSVAAFLDSAVTRGEPLYLDVVLGLVRQVCRGLQAVHDRGIVHRDIKPANMLMDRSYRVVLADFGLAASLDPRFSSTLAGTPLYIAPELIRGEQIPEEQLHLCDIYALGVSIYELLTGAGPFEGDSLREVLDCHLSTPPPRVSDLRPDIPMAFDKVLVRALHKDPAQRHQSCRELFEDLFAAREGRSADRLVLVDLELPQGDLRACACINADQPDAEIPVLAITAPRG